MNTLKLKFDDELFNAINSTGKFKIEFSHFEDTDETHNLLYMITSSPEMGYPDILREYEEVIAELNKLADDDNYCYYPTFEWELNEEWWNKTAVYEIVENKEYNN